LNWPGLAPTIPGIRTDLCDAHSSFTSGAPATLNEIARMMGCRESPGEIDRGQLQLLLICIHGLKVPIRSAVF
jgi:hypothetical protein